MIAAVFLPAIFIGLRACRLLFSIADGFERVRAHTILGQRLLRIRTKISLVVIEVNVFDRLGKELIVRDGRWRGRRSRRWGWGGRYGNLRCSLLRSRRAFRGQMIRC